MQEKALSCVGFPEFTRIFNPPFDGKLQSCVQFTMTIGAQKHAFLDLLFDLCPATGVPPIGDTKVLF